MTENIVMQAEAAFTAKDFLRAASFYAKVVYLFPSTCAMAIHNRCEFLIIYRYHHKRAWTIYNKPLLAYKQGR